ncbi:P-loop containing nucleoside triphosphate hydrolase protein [Xylaria bambusicola]|uniref:P-loop containing nucleoside triphosphate hydrolase protein n=1 Tax=Xylaria bambusicola TaxID=326684 RepID=UPI0020085C8F|nr:P-loop containing nucleoside triphosphate hydrolase protein [Xylaria bambusicola]KAI0517722.1 P-loop containing nucleoside triphosphate hydrolase protein [Xylaria bambusicola]
MQPSRGEVLQFRSRKVRSKDPYSNMESGNFTRRGKGRQYASPPVNQDLVSTTDTVQDTTRPPRQTSSVYWKSLGYALQSRHNTHQILQDIEGWVMPGTLTALMGPTGAGKTTLLDVLSHRTTTGVITGQSTISESQFNCPCYTERIKSGLSCQRRIGYAQQQDVHLPSTTVREALEFSALLRQPSKISKREKLDYVETVLEMLNMQSYADAIIGQPGEGLNTEQRKRLTIAVEMVAKPDLLLFLDEPTSGLNSQIAWSICSLLRKLASNGQTILCTIHQPSSQLFNITVYFGDIGVNGSIMTRYFEENGAPKCHPDENPAEWMMNFTTVDLTDETAIEQDSRGGEWSQKWQRGECRKLSAQSSSHAEGGDEYATSYWCQVGFLTKRIFRDQCRDGTYLYTKVTLSVGLAFINGISFLNTQLSIQGVTSILFSSFLLLQMFTSVGQLVSTRLAANRDLFESRERNSKMYSWYALLIANILIESSWKILISIPMFVVFAASLSQPGTALQLATLFYWLSLPFCGVIISPNSLPNFWIFLYRSSPLTYFVQGIAVAGLSGAYITCAPVELIQIPSDGYLVNADATDYCQFCPVSNAHSVLGQLGIETRDPWHNAYLLSSYIVFNVLAIFLVYRWSRVSKGKSL